VGAALLLSHWPLRPLLTPHPQLPPDRHHHKQDAAAASSDPNQQQQPIQLEAEDAPSEFEQQLVQVYRNTILVSGAAMFGSIWQWNFGARALLLSADLKGSAHAAVRTL